MIVLRLTAEEVDRIFFDCLFRDHELSRGVIPARATIADGFILSIGFHPDRLESHRDEVRALLDQLPEQFSTPRGASFHDACVNRWGGQWTDSPHTVDQLIVLGLALDQVVCLFSFDMWPLLPDAVPYYMVRS